MNGASKTFAMGLISAVVCAALAGQSAYGDTDRQAPAVSLYNLALQAYNRGMTEEAVLFFKRACDVDPDLADAQYNLGVIYQIQKRLPEAVSRFKEVLRLKPDDADAHYQLALALIDLGEVGQAREHLSSVLAGNRHSADARKRLGELDNEAHRLPEQMSPPVSPVRAITTGAPALPQQGNAGQDNQHSAQPTGHTLNESRVQDGAVVLPGTSVSVVATGFSAPGGLAFDRRGDLYVANFTSNTIDRINADGSKSLFSSGPHLQGPIGLAMDDRDNLYIANYTGGTIVRITQDGKFETIATGFNKPYYLALDRNGNLFVSQQKDYSILRISMPEPIESEKR